MIFALKSAEFKSEEPSPFPHWVNLPDCRRLLWTAPWQFCRG